MRMLFAISVIALLALLWASISIAHHIRQARQRRRKQNEDQRLAQLTPPDTSTSQTPKRADLAYYNKDMGDLSDPYESPSKGPKSPTGQ